MNSKTKSTNNDLEAGEIISQASVPDKDQIVRQIRRGKETGAEGDERDVAGSVSANETPQGREESKRRSKMEESN